MQAGVARRDPRRVPPLEADADSGRAASKPDRELPPPDSTSGPFWRLWAPSLLVALVLTVTVLGGLRGTDQYWYHDNTKRLAAGEGIETHAVYPGPLLRGEFETSTPIVHNTPLLHLNATIARVTGALWAWKLGNTAWLALSCWLVYQITAFATTGAPTRAAGRRDSVPHATSGGASAATHAPATLHWPWIAALLYGTAPIVIWFNSNLVQEPFLATLATAVVYIALRHGFHRTVGWLLIPLLLLGSLSHPLFTLLALAVIADGLVCGAPRRRLGAILIAIVSAELLKPTVFPSAFPPGIANIVAASAPDGSNVLWHLREQLPSITPELIWQKLVASVQQHLFELHRWPFQIITVLGVIAGVALAVTAPRRHARLLMYAAVLYGCWLGIAILTQPQPRYQMLVAPIAVVLIATALRAAHGRTRVRLANRFAVVLFAFGVALGVVSAVEIKRDQDRDASAIAKLMDYLGTLPEDSRIVVQGRNPIGHFLALYHALAPRPVLFLGPFDLEKAAIGRVVRIFEPDVLISVPELGAGLPSDSPDLVLEEPTGRYTRLHVHHLGRR